MERIQSALAKARAARQGKGQPRQTGRGAAPQNSDADQALLEAWLAVPEAQLNRKRLLSRRITAFESGRSSAEFDRLRTRILSLTRPNGWRKIAIVSPSAQSGKSTVAANLAFSMARHSHRNTLLMELDLRRPALASMLGLSPALDVSRVLAGKDELTRHAVRFGPNLIVAPSHSVQGGAAEFLQAPSTVEAMEAVIDAYEPSIVLLDMPPMGAGDDVIGFLGHVDCALIVVAAGSATLDQIDACEREVAQLTNVLGVVLNKCRYESQAPEDNDYY